MKIVEAYAKPVSIGIAIAAAIFGAFKFVEFMLEEFDETEGLDTD